MSKVVSIEDRRSLPKGKMDFNFTNTNCRMQITSCADRFYQIIFPGQKEVRIPFPNDPEEANQLQIYAVNIASRHPREEVISLIQKECDRLSVGPIAPVAKSTSSEANILIFPEQTNTRGVQ